MLEISGFTPCQIWASAQIREAEKAGV